MSIIDNEWYDQKDFSELQLLEAKKEAKLRVQKAWKRLGPIAPWSITHIHQAVLGDIAKRDGIKPRELSDGIRN